MKVRGSHIWLLPGIGFDMKRESVPVGVWKYYDEQGVELKSEAWYNGQKR